MFEYLADVGNLPRYFDRMTAAEPEPGDAVHVTADVDGEKVDAEAWFTVDRTARRIQWGSEGPHDYHGTLDLRADQDRTIVEIELHTSHEAQSIDDALETTLDNIQERLEVS